MRIARIAISHLADYRLRDAKRRKSSFGFTENSFLDRASGEFIIKYEYTEFGLGVFLKTF